MKHCKKCLFPDTKPDLYFDKEGICDACRTAEKKHNIEQGINWDERKKQFEEIINKHRSKDGLNYDCIVPVSGGKDSMFQVYAMKILHNMNPLAVTFDQFDQTEIGRHNLEILKKIGVDHIHFTLNPHIIKRLVKKGFEIVGDPYWVNHVGIFTIPYRIAVAFNIPLIIWGENSQIEYGGPEKEKNRNILDKRWRQEFGGMRGFREEDMTDEDILMSDLRFLTFPSDEEIRNVGVRGLFYGYYFKWNSKKNLEVSQKLGWKSLLKAPAGSWLDWENCDMKFIDVREHLKWVKFGYGRTTDQVNIFIRNGDLSREEGEKIVKEFDGKIKNKKEFSDFIGITEDEFDRIRDTFVNKDIFEKNENGEWRFKKDLINYKIEQSAKWAGDFGNKYIDRNPGNSDELDNLYLKNFGVSRTSLNKYFLKEISKNSNILEIGCNKGPQLDSLQKLGFENLTGIDVSEKALEIAKLKLPKLNFLKSSALDLPFEDNSFDLIFTSGVLIHIHPNDLLKIIDKIYKISKKYIFCYEYFSENCEEIEYRGYKNLLWKNNFMGLFLERFPNLRVVREKKLNYLENENIDHMFLLEKVDKLEFFVENFPRVVRIEPSSLCNLKCVHCPTGTVNMPREIMKWEVFEKILKEVKEHKDSIKVAVLYHGGEPLLNKDIIKMIQELKKLGIEKIKTNTNGMLLDEDICVRLINSGIDEIEISIDGTSPNMNNQIRRGSDYFKIVNNVKMLCKKKNQLNLLKPKVVIANVQFFKEKDESVTPKIPEFLIDEFKGFDVSFKLDYAMCWPVMKVNEELFNIIEKGRKNNYCDHVVNTITIRADGTVVPCCYDLTTESPLGNIKNNSLEEIWNNNKYFNLRKSIYKGGNNNLCKNCANINPSFYLSWKSKKCF